VLVALVGLLFIGGLIRTVRKRRAERRNPTDPDAAIEPDAASTAGVGAHEQ